MRAAGVIGWPVAHSKSPIIHRFWLDALGLDGDYGRFAVAPERLADALRALPALGLVGVNVTVPHKVAAMAQLDGVDSVAALVGAVNIVTVRDGGLWGSNSDVAGFLEPLGARRFGTAVVVGAGGAARAALVGLADRAARLVVLNRSLDRARALVADLGIDAEVRPLSAGAPDCDLLVNASPLGMAGQPPLALAIAGAPLVYDLVYAPLETALLNAARARGLETVDGLHMLVGQAAVAFAQFFGTAAPRDRDAALRALLTA